MLNDWATKLDQFLAFNNRDVLQGTGQVSKADADNKAKVEYDKYAQHRRSLKETEGEKMNIELKSHEKELSQNLEEMTKTKTELEIDMDNPRLIQAIRMIIYFSEVFPKKHFEIFKHIL